MSGKRRFQFGLRKLLLWTAVVAIYLGILTTFRLDLREPMNLINFITLGLWAIIIGLVRAAFNARVAAALSAVTGVILSALGLYLSARWSSVSLFAFPDRVVLGLAIGGLLGLIIFACVELTFRAVNWADNLMRSKSDRD